MRLVLVRAPTTGVTAATELPSSITGMNRLGFPATLWRTSGRSNVHPTKVAMAPALWRMIAPIPTPNKARSARKALDSTRARRTPGSPRARWAAPREDGLADEERKEAQRETETEGHRAQDDGLGSEEHRATRGRHEG